MEAVPRPLGGESWFTSRSLIERIVLFAKHADAVGGLVKVRFGAVAKGPSAHAAPGAAGTHNPAEANIVLESGEVPEGG
jgi:hypothetical protein